MDKKELFSIIDKNAEKIIALGDKLFDCPELGFKEFKTAEMIKEELDSLGISYESEIGMTGIKAVLGDGDYNIGVVCDIDALPGKSFSGTIHSCGHSIQTAIGLGTARALKESGILEGSGVRVSFIFTPAEEFIDFEYRDNLIKEGKIRYRSGKQHMISAGYFDDVDCVLSAHGSQYNDKLLDINSTLSGFLAKKAVFKGQASHAGAAPHLGRSTLHGAVLFENAIHFLKEQFAPEQGVRLNPVITEPGGSVNIIPDRTVMEMYVRANDIETLEYLNDRVDLCIKNSAEMLELGYEIENTIGYMPLKQSDELNRVIKDNMLLICEDSLIKENTVSSASGDVGDLCSILPVIQFGFGGIEGIFHSDSFAVADKNNCYINTVKVMCGAVKDLADNESLRVKNENFEADKEKYLKNWLKEK